ncbi:hypothetical protein [Microcoleus phage My-WqHQDG]|nr:hypothetical protein [Microcoleus phage My-WqHQDG]
MGGISVWLEPPPSTPGGPLGPHNIILPLILMGVEVSDTGEPVRDYYYTIWSQDEVEHYRSRMYNIMGWDDSTPTDPRALVIAKTGARLLRIEYITLWDMYFPTLRLLTYGTSKRRRLVGLIRGMPVRPPFITDN